MNKRLVVAVLALLPLGVAPNALAQQNVLSDGGGGAAFGKNVLSGSGSTRATRNVLNPSGADMRAGNAIPNNRADMNAGNAIPGNRADMSAGNAIPGNRADMSAGNVLGAGGSGGEAPNAIGRGQNVIESGESALRANNVIEQRSRATEAENAMNPRGVLEGGRSAFSTSSTQNALTSGTGVDARRAIGAAEAVDSRRSVGEAQAVDGRPEVRRARIIDHASNAFGNDQLGVSVGGVAGALEIALPGHGSPTPTADGAGAAGNASNVLREGRSAFSEEFRSRLAERNERRGVDQWWEAKNAFDGSITETTRETPGFGQSAFR